MATIRDILEKDVDRDIDGVIKADDDRQLGVEVDEYVITREIQPKLEELLENYITPGSSNGVWISGFFGSGKSHLLKMLSLLLENREIDGRTVCDTFLKKKEIADDALFQGVIEKAGKIPSKSILFNIDQKADAVGGDPDAALLEVFAKVLNEAQGFYPKLDYIAQFERGLAKEGKLDGFKASYQEESGSTWEDHLDDIDVIYNEEFARAYAKFFEKSEEEGLRLFDRLREKYKLSVEELAGRVKDYLDTLGPDARVNFFVDEVGQFIGRRSKLMLNLQTIAETLSTKCEGRAWVFVTSQGDIQSVIGKLEEPDGEDFSKIQGRFTNRPSLTSANVEEVIQKRLLAKKEESVSDLEALFDAERENLRTLFTFGDGSRDYKGFTDADHFAKFTPFHPFQFDLFQTSIERLSQHDAFTGKHASVGERSMLSVFQEVAKHIADLPINTFATFDLMFEGLSNVLRGDFQRGVKSADKNLRADHPMAVRILKSLFLLKYVNEFKSSPRNIAILLIDRADIDIAAHEEEVKQELNFLYSQHYLQKNGDLYEFLTDEEKDIEVEIKNTRVGDDKVSKLLDKVLFGDVIRETKIRYEENGQDYPFQRRLDEADFGRVQDLKVHLVTADHDNANDLSTLMSQNTGRRELLVILPNDRTLNDEARLFEQTQSYISKATASDLSGPKKAILRERGQQNGTRMSEMGTRAKDLIARADFIINGSKVEVGGTDPRVRLQNAFQKLIHFVYPNLRMLKADYKEAMIPKILEEENDLISETLSEAEQEVLAFLQRKKFAGERVEITPVLTNFRQGNYGWPDAATLCLMARLFRRHKIELKSGSDVLDQEEVAVALGNSNKHGSIFVQIQEEFDAATVTAVKNFHHDFFNQSSPGNDAKSVSKGLLKALAAEASQLDTLIARKSEFPFVATLEPIRDRIQEISEHDYNYPLKNLRDFDDDLLTSKEDYIDPIKNFVNGTNGKSFREIADFLRDQGRNLSPSDDTASDLRAVVDSATPFRGDTMRTAVTALKKAKTEIEARLEQTRSDAVAKIEEREDLLKANPQFAALDDKAKEKLLFNSQMTKEKIGREVLLPVIADQLRKYEEGGFSQQLAQLTKPKTKYKQRDGEQGKEKDDVEEADPSFPHISQFTRIAADGKIVLSNTADVEAFMGRLKSEIDAHIAEGKEITL